MFVLDRNTHVPPLVSPMEMNGKILMGSARTVKAIPKLEKALRAR
jgi:hypothetical protein